MPAGYDLGRGHGVVRPASYSGAMFSVQERVRARLLELAEADPGVVAAAITARMPPVGRPVVGHRPGVRHRRGAG